MRKFGYSEHCVYTGAMLSFLYVFYPILVSGISLSGADVFGDAFSGIDWNGCFLEDWFLGT